jgi:DsbC/DsbD-like thiol-disulfide interchange protein
LIKRFAQVLIVFANLVFTVLVSSVVAVQAAPYATDWVEGHNSRTRLIIGGAPGSNGRVARYAALEIALSSGWKTYWRQPGSAGGIPPQLSWQGSSNLKSPKLHYPAPARFVDPTGATIGYKNSVVFPIAIEPEDPARPMVLNLKAFFGVCREICIPAQAAFQVTLGADLFLQTPPELAKALSRLPVTVVAPPGKAAVGPYPGLVRAAKTETSHASPVLLFDVRLPEGVSDADLFAETGDEQPLDMSEIVARPDANTVRFKVAVRDQAEWAHLARTGLVLTMVSERGASEIRLPRP